MFTFYPAVQSLYYSFTDYDMFNIENPIGLKNYKMIFTLDPDTWQVIRNTLIYAAVSIPLNLALGFFLAQFLGLSTMAITIFGAIIAFIIYLFGENKEKEAA